ncbi:helix-hairpin-helix domain-containing protein [Paenibacillus sp. HWE-109]|uniref:ComEA family DNA-binding protein n=1 Tax=Paenibacillus sp. HWE-109 TaxID=1306526 RepID=UPI001EDE5104|nr:helix-hairpin-helix domain-containing protein [Paenibacillus sp. HWE-109]UKS30406.1 helix-hairpin-helix domain-containing protein [Paenibacillus sp. HWE-109]
MDLFRYNKSRLLLIVAAISLFMFVVWPFILGGRSRIETKFEPMNRQMQVMIDQQEEGPGALPDDQPSKLLEAASTAVSRSKPQTVAPDIKGKLDLNIMTFEQLKDLPGIGDSKAQAILDYRSQKGSFTQVEELMEVKGIGEKMLVKLKPLLYVGSP